MATMPESPATRPAARHRGRASRRGHPRLVVALCSTAFVFLVVAGLGAWVASSAVSVTASLERAERLAGELRGRVAADDLDGALAVVDDLARNTSDAADTTNQPVWRLFEVVPLVGANLTAVRQIADVVDRVTVDAVRPLARVTLGGFDSFRPIEDRIDVGKVAAVAGAVAKADESLAKAVGEIDRIDTGGTVRQVAAAKLRLGQLLATSGETMAELRRLTDVATGVLGAEGPRDYILLFPNNAESVSLGGNTAAWLIVHVDDGLITITDQPSSADFDRSLGSPIALPPELSQVYDPGLFGYVTNTELRPDFPTAAALAQGFWARKTGQVVDGVMSFDPIALAYLLEATGPITLPSGHVLSDDNAVKLLLSDVYSMYDDPADQDAFFAQAASTVFTTVTTSTPQVNALITALVRAVDDNRLMVWSAHPEEQALIAGTPLQGILAPDNVDMTQIGVFFVENSASKMSYYLQTAVSVTLDRCAAPDAPAFTTRIDLRSAIAPAEYEALPSYVKAHAYTSPPMTRTLVYVYGPAGAAYVGATWDGGGTDSRVRAVASDLGRPVVALTVDLQPDESSSVSVAFAGAPGAYGPVTARVTPMVQPTVVTESNPGCD